MSETVPVAGSEPTSDTLTIVIHLPQPLDKVTAILGSLAEEWPKAKFVDGLSRLEIPADEPRRGY